MLTKAGLSILYLNYWHLSSFVNTHIFLRSCLYFSRMSGFQVELIYDIYKVNTRLQWNGFPRVITSMSSSSIYDPDSLTGHRSCSLCSRTLSITSEWITAAVNYQMPRGLQDSQQDWQHAGRKQAKKLIFPWCIPLA